MTGQERTAWSSVAREHATRPRNYGQPEGWEGYARITGPCGDTMEFWVTLRGAVVARASFVTDGCGASRACGSMAATIAEGRRLRDVMAIEQAEILEALDGIPVDSEHCALLAANTLRMACKKASTPGT